jgi:hypothetical protein
MVVFAVYALDLFEESGFAGVVKTKDQYRVFRLAGRLHVNGFTQVIHFGWKDAGLVTVRKERNMSLLMC